MHHAVHAPRRTAYVVVVPDVGAVELDVLVLQERQVLVRGHILVEHAPRQVVQGHDIVTPLRVVQGGVRAYEPRSARDEELHPMFLKYRCSIGV